MTSGDSPRTAKVNESSDGQLVAEVRQGKRLECVVAGPAEEVLGALLGLGFEQAEVQGVPERLVGSNWNRVDPSALLQI